MQSLSFKLKVLNLISDPKNKYVASIFIQTGLKQADKLQQFIVAAPTPLLMKPFAKRVLTVIRVIAIVNALVLRVTVMTSHLLILWKKRVSLLKKV